MDDALAAMADALQVAPLSADDQRLLLDCARDVAHATQRRYAPLSTFMIGLALGAARDVDPMGALQRAIDTLTAALPTQAPADVPGPQDG
jgi:hypothetical protein